MLRNKLMHIGLAFGAPLMLNHVSAFAQEASGARVEQLSEMQGDTALINAEVARIKAQAALQAARNELRGAIAEGAAIDGKINPSTEIEDVVQPETMPQVISIYGTGKTLYAVLRYPSGLQVDVRPRENLDGDYVVKSITTSRVVLSRADKEYVLRAHTGAVSSFAGNQTAMSNGISPMPGGQSVPANGMPFSPSLSPR